MFIPVPYFSPSRILDPGSDNNEKGDGEKIVVLPFFGATNFTNLKMFNFSTGTVPRRLFFAAPQRIAITSSPNYYQKMQRSTQERIEKNMAQMSCKFGEIIKKL